MLNELLTLDQVAALLKVDPATVQRMGVPRVPLPGRGERPIWRYDREQVEAWWRDRQANYFAVKPIRRAS